jgi:DNA modification methylase
MASHGTNDREMNHLYYGDNLQVLRDSIATESVDLVYLDPPFNSQANYNVLFRSPTGMQSQAQIEAFEDTWHWNDAAEKAFDEVITSGNSEVAEMLRAMRSFLKENDMMAYLTMMAVRLLELHRVLKPTGSLYLHCDPTASHYLKILLDGIFGKLNFKNEIIWKRTSAHSSAKRYGPVHDVILFYGKSEDVSWIGGHQAYDDEYLTQRFARGDDRPWKDADLTGSGIRHGQTGEVWRGFDVTAKGRHWAYPPAELDRLDSAGFIYWPNKKGGWPRYKKYLDDAKGIPLQDVWTDIFPINSQAQERLGYPTQKPLVLLERLIEASTNEGDVVLDPFCGCGTAVHAAQKLRRNWIGIDVTHLAISLIERRLKDAFPAIRFDVHGTPKDIEGARALALLDKYQFQWWAVSLVDAVPYGGKKKGVDGGIDGHIYFKPDGKTTEKAIVSVKGGDNVGVTMVRDLGHVIDREKAKVGVFITLTEPTKPMLIEAVKAGYYVTNHGKFPKIQILTIADLFAGRKPQLPWVDPASFRKAVEEVKAKQVSLF